MDSKARVLAILAENRGIAVEKLQSSDRLLHDLGMDGDDAEDFFNDLQCEFTVDLGDLHEHWLEHFRGEHLSLVDVVVTAICVAIGFVLSASLGVGHPLVWTAAVLVLWLALLKGWPLQGRSLVPITITEVLRSVDQGHWVKDYNGTGKAEPTGLFWMRAPKR